MSKSWGQKLKLIAVLDVLREHSDEENPITASAICDLLAERGITAERKSVYADIEALTDYGYDIVRSYSPKGFFLGSREFEEAEIYLLSDAVRTAKFISPKKTRVLVKKLGSLLSRGQRKKREKDIYFNPSQKCSNEEIFYNIDTISQAIRQNKMVEFDYVSRELKGREFVDVIKRLWVSPYALTWQDDHYYLICNFQKYDNLVHMRLDRMSKVKIRKEAARHFSEVSEYTDFFDVADYTNKIFGMYTGNIQTIELCCKKKLAKTVVDRFSENIFITNVTDDEFCFSYKAAVSDALVTFLLNFGDEIRVINPQNLKEMIVNRAEKVINMYKS
ncbi:MAG: WYL domain-containing protein [Clostridia bacterium]|nr:WYL domain-containing protein [Clostridia bacterium]MBR6564423.1 WYL domain-containing protein [Clostridia bacterium]